MKITLTLTVLVLAASALIVLWKPHKPVQASAFIPQVEEPEENVPQRRETPAPKKVERPRGDKWQALAMCESRMRQEAHSASGKHHSFFQWALSTWHSLGYTGDPHDYPYEVQVEAAKKLYARSGANQWPTCGKRAGL